MPYETEQESFWAGQFGTEYTKRSSSLKALPSCIHLFSKILSKTTKVTSVIEFGANLGRNLQAINIINPTAELSAVEINDEAVKKLKEKNIKTYQTSILNFKTNQKYDFALIKGVLIHINPEKLPFVYDIIYHSSRKYICVAEYYNPTPIEVEYRGHSGKLFKRDFAGELLDKFPNLSLVDYGFGYHKDNNFPQGDITWFLMEKQ